MAGHVAEEDVSPGREMDDDVSGPCPRRLDGSDESVLERLLVDREAIDTKRQGTLPGMDDEELMRDRPQILQDEGYVSSPDFVRRRDVEVALGDRDNGQSTVGCATAPRSQENDGQRRPNHFVPHSWSIGLDAVRQEPQNGRRPITLLCT
jgi:hypothetical protein